MAKTVLVVDDQPGIRMLLEEVIKSEGFNVLQAVTGEEALSVVREKHPDLMLLDYKLPVKDGIEVIEDLEKDNIHIASVLMSGLAEDELKDAHQHESVLEVVAKPFNIQEMKDIIVNLLK
ncbi:response regulator [Pontibacillus marinus]|uniref:Response regulatory domain-containing protein n=1 Tax=Pontibacillus marinus BH030004 = DSM 16465 TaxID=1385511 RepID=A0A0A5FZY9_9BACI|nr:response regulator [Pontibacillus marinus]KGX86396.1 hypothetical protein N783_12160 [Pontibacillus marinus BH030004 = DSM 16465]